MRKNISLIIVVVCVFFLASSGGSQAWTGKEIVKESSARFRQIGGSGVEEEMAIALMMGYSGNFDIKALHRFVEFDCIGGEDKISIEITKTKNAKDRGVKLLIWKGAESNQVWMQIRRGKVRGVSDRNQGKAFVGTDFSIIDIYNLLSERLSDYEYSIKSEDQNYWIIEAFANEDSKEKMIYEKRVFIVDKKTFAIIKIDYWKSGEVEKTQFNKEIVIIGSSKVWRSNLIEMKNNFIGRTTFYGIAVRLENYLTLKQLKGIDLRDFQNTKREFILKIPNSKFNKRFFQ